VEEALKDAASTTHPPGSYLNPIVDAHLRSPDEDLGKNVDCTNRVEKYVYPGAPAVHCNHIFPWTDLVQRGGDRYEYLCIVRRNVFGRETTKFYCLSDGDVIKMDW
jgi:hypothetical protein